VKGDLVMLSDDVLVAWAEQAKRDDWHLCFVGSDIRQLIGQHGAQQTPRMVKRGLSRS
jgi:hypothetical protein